MRGVRIKARIQPPHPQPFSPGVPTDFLGLIDLTWQRDARASGSSESEVELVSVEPRDARVDLIPG